MLQKQKIKKSDFACMSTDWLPRPSSMSDTEQGEAAGTPLKRSLCPLPPQPAFPTQIPRAEITRLPVQKHRRGECKIPSPFLQFKGGFSASWCLCFTAFSFFHCFSSCRWLSVAFPLYWPRKEKGWRKFTRNFWRWFPVVFRFNYIGSKGYLGSIQDQQDLLW